MGEPLKLVFEPNGLLDFFPTPPQSTGDGLEPSTKSQSRSVEPRPDQFEYDDDDGPPPDFEEEPSDFEDEVMGIMERQKQSSSSRPPTQGMDIDFDEDEDMPVASCESPKFETG
jgi:hypothetical protein